MTNTGKPVRVSTLDKGAEATAGRRNTIYGDPKINLACAGELKKLARKWAGIARGRVISDGEWEAIDLALTKIGRILTGLKVHEDNYVDGAVYLAIAYEIASSPEPTFVLSPSVIGEIEKSLQDPDDPETQRVARKFAPLSRASTDLAPASTAESDQPRQAKSP